MKKPTFFTFLRQEITFFIFSLFLLVPVSLFFRSFVMLTIRNLQDVNEIYSDLLTYLSFCVFILSALGSICLTFYFAVSEQIQNIMRRFALLRLEGEAEKALKAWISGFFALLTVGVIVCGQLVGYLNFWYVLPSLVLNGGTIIIVNVLLGKQADSDFNK